jgi:porphobilinogen synthase
MYPLFISDNPDAMEPIPTLPKQYRIGKNKLIEYLSSYINQGLQSVLLFATMSQGKDERASMADDITNPIMQVIPLLKIFYPQLYIACDLCLCAYTSHGHCGLLNEKGLINNEASIERLAEVALKYSQQGCHMIAPSDMMDGRVYSIKQILRKNGLDGVVAVMSYSAKFASCFYGPFRNAAQSAPTFGDRKCYQLPPGSRGLAMRAIDRDINEGADIIMIKPGIPYLDILREAKLRHPEIPLAVYHVSGEYSSLVYASEAGVFELKNAVIECMDAFHRAGATIIITYFTPFLLDWLQ